MKNVKLISLHVEGFRGITDFSLRAGGKSVTVRGANGTGKSTLAAAFLWCLTGKDEQGRSGYNIFPLAADGQRNFGFEPSVTAVLDADGESITLRRKIVEKWTARRGAVKKEYAGDETQYFVDDVPVSASTYADRICALCPERLLPLLLNVSWFSERTKDYRERRKLLLEQFGGFSQADVIGSDAQLSHLAERMGRHSVEEYMEICTEQRKKSREKLDTLPARMDENRRQLREAPDANAISSERDRCNAEIASLRYEIEHLSEEQIRKEKKSELLLVQEQLRSTQAKLQIEESGFAGAWRQEHDRQVDQAREEQRRCDEEAHAAQLRLQQAEADLARTQHQRDKLREEWVTVNEKNYTAESVCPACGQALPEEMLRSARENFNLSKSARLEEIASQGAHASEATDATSARVEACRKSCESAKEDARRAALALERARSEAPPRVLPDSCAILRAQEEKLKKREEELERELFDSERSAEEAAHEMKSKLRDAQSRADGLNAKLAEIGMNADRERRIRELEEEQRDALRRLEDAEEGIALCQTYFSRMARHMTEQINKHFDTVNFFLFEKQKNGGLREICEASVDGVPYGALNTAAKMQANLEIVRAFSEGAGITMPLFVDNRESVSEIHAPAWMQVISLTVDAGAAALQTEGDV